MAGILERFQLDGRVAIVTGASRGLGSGMAEALAEAGADVVAVARGSTQSLRARVEGLGRRFHAVQVDIADAGSAAAILAECERVLGGADILVNNAGIIRRAPFLEFSDKDWKDVLDVNLGAAFRLSQEFARRLVARKAPGKIINIASMLSFQGGVRVASYTASKGAIHSLTMLMANELAPLGINVNAIAPGYMATDNTEQLRADADRNKAILERIPAGRWGTPEDLKGAVVFLSSAASDYMHGFTVAVDGGWLGR
jgi:2-deoxy-D-gluconate 3-dehydrogenase